MRIAFVDCQAPGMQRIEPYLIWIGHAGDGRNFHALYDSGIGAIVQLAIDEPAIQTPRELIYLRVPLLDGDGNESEMLLLAIRTLKSLIEAGVPTLVCCSAGMSRSPAIVAAALAMTLRCDHDQALKDVVQSHPADVSPSLWAAIKSAVAGATD
jgi:hypothetical protein